MDWFRWYHGSVADPKFTVVARRSKQPKPVVLCVWQAVLEHASEHEDRGSLHGLDAEVVAAAIDVEPEDVAAVLAAMQDRGLIRDGRVANWDKRQPKREDDSRDRVRAFRERQRQQAEAARPAYGNGHDTPGNADETAGNDDVTPCNADVTPQSREDTEQNNPPPKPPPLQGGGRNAERSRRRRAQAAEPDGRPDAADDLVHGATRAIWRERLKAFRRSKLWRGDSWGPKPTEPHCNAPPELVAEILGERVAA